MTVTSAKGFFSKKVGRNLLMVVGMILLMVVFNLLTGNIFTSVRNLTLLMKQGAVLMITASGMMLLLIERNFDLSTGAAVYFVSVVAAQCAVTYQLGLVPSILISLVVGFVMGSINGFFIGRVGIPAFIGTLAAQLVFKGVGYTWTNAATIGPVPENFAWLSEGYIPPLASAVLIVAAAAAACMMCIHNYRMMKQWYGSANQLILRILSVLLAAVLAIWIFTGYYGIPMCVFFAALVVLMTGFISNKTVFGRHIYIIGGNPEAASLSGIRTKRRILQSYLYMGLIYGVAGIVLTARLGGSTATSGNLLDLDSVAACCIGGTSMSGGVGRITGVLLGVLILSGVDNVMSLMNVSSYLQMVVKGLILLMAVCGDVIMNQTKFRLKKTAQ